MTEGRDFRVKNQEVKRQEEEPRISSRQPETKTNVPPASLRGTKQSLYRTFLLMYPNNALALMQSSEIASYLAMTRGKVVMTLCYLFLILVSWLLASLFLSWFLALGALLPPSTFI